MNLSNVCFSLVLLPVLSVVAPKLEADEPQQEAAIRTVRVLTIGNSFAGNAVRYLGNIADSSGTVRILLGTANIGGCTLEKHARLAAESASDPTVKPYKYKQDGADIRLSLQDFLEAEKWDYVTLQQMSALSYKPETYFPHIEQIAAIVRAHAPSAELLIHETWAYRPDSPLLKEDNLTQQEMYQRLKHAYGDAAEKLGCRIIPAGSAFQIARSVEGREVLVRDPDYDFENPVYPNLPQQTNSLVTGWRWSTKDDTHRLSLDYKHGNTKGCFLVGLVWYEILTGNDARTTSYTPSEVTEEDAVFFRNVAHAAANVPQRAMAQ